MHRKKTRRLAILLTYISTIVFAVTGFVAQTVRANSETPPAVCSVEECTVTFEYSGKPYLWTLPRGASNLRFDLFGAQGGQGSQSSIGGGLGGKVSGILTSPPESLWIYVGGAGVRGAGVPGGYNGGGSAGSGHGDEGSGGGATDIRTEAEFQERIVVAGGGGGAGGYNWLSAGLGGLGGGLTGGAGGWGQADPGLGGDQTSGGQAGRPNGGSAGSAGSLGVGGRGASSFFSGGGGGGGGYFGGGGGGSDTDSCCYNGGGGGGGSSYADARFTSGVEHASGVRVGNGLAVISYRFGQLDPSPIASASPTSSTEPSESTSLTSTAEPTPVPTPSSSEAPSAATPATPATPVTPAVPAIPAAPSLSNLPVASQIVEQITRPTQEPAPEPSLEQSTQSSGSREVEEPATNEPEVEPQLSVTAIDTASQATQSTLISSANEQSGVVEPDLPQKPQPRAAQEPISDVDWVTGPIFGAAVLLGGLLGYWISQSKSRRDPASLRRIFS